MNLKTWHLSFLAAMASVAGAQTVENTPDTWIYSLEAGVRYDDNRDATRDDTEDQTTFRVTPGIRFTMDDMVTRAFFAYNPSVLWRNNPRDDQNDSELYHLAELNIERDISSRFTVGGLNRYEMTDDPNVSSGGAVVRENASYWVNLSKLWLGYALDDRTQWDLDGAYTIRRYDDNDFGRLADEQRFMANTGLRYELEPGYTAFTFLGYDQPSYRGDTRGDYRGYLGGAGLSRVFNEQLTGTAAAGYEFINYQDAVEDDTSLPYLRLSTDYRHTESLRLQAAAEYSMEPSDRSFYSSKEYLRLMIRGVYALTQDLSADARVVYANGRYDSDSVIEDAGADVVDEGDGDDTLMDYQLGLSFRPPARRYYGRLAYEFEDWTSDVRESFSRNTVSATVGVEF